MAAILRVKRRNDVEPLDTLVIACKRRKTEESNEAVEPLKLTPVTAIVKFAGTVSDQGADVVEHIAKTLSKDELKATYKQHTVDVLAKARENVKQTSIENRYKVINCFRSLDTSNVEEFEDKVMTVIDVEDSVSCSKKQDSTEEDESYVYDLYYAQTGKGVVIDDVISVHTLDQELVFDTYRDHGHSENECESEDSNSESNWRNDYPDSDHSKRSTDEEDMCCVVMKMKLSDESDSSSADDFVYAVDEKDVEQYGYKYAKYKVRLNKEFCESDTDSDLIDDSRTGESDSNEFSSDN
ncbi:hypothetical protein KM043_009188 [Ampulex compressa]|nr:hypothetical protein KM043_009188 [Ampulex compressa]